MYLIKLKKRKSLDNITILKKYIPVLKIGGLVLCFSQAIGWVLNLIVGVSYRGLFLIPTNVVIIDSLALGFAVWVSLYFTRYLVDRSDRAFLLLLLSFGLLFGTGTISRAVFFLSSPASFLYADNRLVNYLLINLLFFISLNVIANGFIILQHRVLDREIALSKEKSLKTQMELNLLASKINPHFLFNSLNLMVSLLKNPEKAETALINLSDILRYQLDFTDEPTVTLRTELTIVEKYLALQQMRFGNRLDFQISGEASGQILPMILQPLVENSINHNIDHTDRLNIEITISESDSGLTISVIDSMAGLRPEMMDKGVGLTVTKQRIELSGGRFEIKNGGVEISFKP